MKKYIILPDGVTIPKDKIVSLGYTIREHSQRPHFLFQVLGVEGFFAGELVDRGEIDKRMQEMREEIWGKESE